MRATIKDVAAAAGVSIKTVSRVLNNERYVGAATREKVQAAAAELRFRASPVVQGPADRRALSLLLVCDGPSAYYLAELQAGARARCDADGVRLIVQPCDRRSPRLADDVVAMVDAVHADGVILPPPISDDVALRARLGERGVRVVPISAAASDGGASVGMDDARAAAVVTRHLLALGHRRIGLVGGPAEATAGRLRRDGYRAALDAAGISDDPALSLEGRWDFASGARAAASLLQLAEPPTAIFAASDAMAAGALSAAQARGLRLPEDLSVAGFGDEAFAAYVWPPLTTIRQPAREIGRVAADLLLTGADERREVAFDLVERGSTIGIGV